MAYGLLVETTNGSNQIDSDTYDDGLSFSYSSGWAGVTQVSKQDFRPDLGDILLVSGSQYEAYMHIVPTSTHYLFRYYAGGLLPNILQQDANPAWVYCRVVRKQGYLPSVNARYGLQVKKPDGSVGFDSTVFSGGGFTFEEVFTAGQINPAPSYRQGVKVSSASFRWVVANSLTVSKSGSTARGAGMRVNSGNIWYYNGFSIPANGIGLSSQNLTNTTDVILARTF